MLCPPYLMQQIPRQNQHKYILWFSFPKRNKPGGGSTMGSRKRPVCLGQGPVEPAIYFRLIPLYENFAGYSKLMAAGYCGVKGGSGCCLLFFSQDIPVRM